jgi:hypothetical protein
VNGPENGFYVAAGRYVPGSSLSRLRGLCSTLALRCRRRRTMPRA